jgi:hypothetical protein
VTTPDHLPRNRAQRIRVIQRIAGYDVPAAKEYVVKETDEEEHHGADRGDIGAPSLPP